MQQLVKPVHRLPAEIGRLLIEFMIEQKKRAAAVSQAAKHIDTATAESAELNKLTQPGNYTQADHLKRSIEE